MDEVAADNDNEENDDIDQDDVVSDYEPQSGGIMSRQNSVRLKEVMSREVMKSIVSEVCEFVMEESEPNVNDIKIVLNRQVKRAELRQKSLTSMLELVKLSDQLIPSAKYYLLSGWQGMYLINIIMYLQIYHNLPELNT